jgi:peptidoglycan hydrolase-like protein with peptidoglycan-binding domain
MPPPPGIGISINAGDSSVARVQRALKKRGYYSGPVDGNAGRSTRSAIRSFRTDNGLSSTSRIDGALLRALGL